MRLAYRMLAAGQLNAVESAAPERHYLPFVPASSDYAYADGGATGVKDTLGWTLVVKTSGRASSNGKGLAQVYDALSGNARWIDLFYTITGYKYDLAGWTAAGALAHLTSLTDTVSTGAQVIAAAHRDTAARRTDLYACKAGATLQKVGGAFGGDARTPLHVGVGAYIDASGGTHLGVALSYEAVNLIALVLLRDLASEAELQAYSLASDARDVWPSAQIWGYWPASSAVAGSILNLGSGTAVPLTLSGPVAGDLVALQEPVTSYYSSPGGAGDYAEASTNVAARVVFPGTSEDPWTISRWLTVPSLATTLGTAMGVRRTSGDPALSLYVSGTDNDGQVTHTVIDGTNGAEIVDAIPALAAACHLALTFDGTTVTTYANGAAVGSSAGSPGALAWGGAGDTLTLMSDATHADPLAGDVRNIMLVDRALTAGEVAALYAAGPTHHPLMPAGVWAGGQSIPVIWCTPAVGGVVANSGDGGTCNLVLSGAVTSEVD